jgi:hypothetical protein
MKTCVRQLTSEVATTLRAVNRHELRVELHPTDYNRIRAAADQLQIPADEFYALAIHTGTETLLRQRGMHLGDENRLVKPY